MLARVEGFATRFDTPDLEGDVIAPGAFSAGGLRFPLPMLHEHRPGAVIGQWQAGREDARGLWVEGVIEAGAVPALAGLLSRRTAAGLSIGFRTLEARALPAGGRRLTAIALIEVSLVDQPMMPAALARIRAPPPTAPAA
jgi:HK97 family phage prohead protease